MEEYDFATECINDAVTNLSLSPVHSFSANGVMDAKKNYIKKAL